MTILSVQALASLEKVAQWLEAGAPHVSLENGRDVGHLDMQVGVVNRGDGCGTACCIAGAVVQFEGLGVLEGGVINQTFFGEGWGDGASKGVGTLATEFLGILHVQARDLFLPWDQFEDDEYTDYEEFDDPKIAARVVRHFMATGEVDWRGQFLGKNAE